MQIDKDIWHFRNYRSWYYWHLCITPIVNKLETIANQMYLNTNLDLSRAYRIKTNVLLILNNLINLRTSDLSLLWVT